MVERIAKLTLKEQLRKIPPQTGLHANRYDDDLHHILHIWDDKENSFDIVVRKDSIGAGDKMTELYVNCKKHGRTHVKEWVLSGFFFGECGCEFDFNGGYVRNLTEERKVDEYNKLHPYDDPRGDMLPDGDFVPRG